MSAGHVHRRRRGGFIENTIEGLYWAMDRALYAESAANAGGLLQRLDARVKVAGLFALLLASALSVRLWVIASILGLAVVLAVCSLISVDTLASQVWAGAFAFTGPLALPAVFLTPGVAVFRLPGLHWTATAQGLHTAGYLILRVETAATLTVLLVFTTPWMHVLKALRVFRAPVVLVVILGMTCRYILLLLETAHEMFEARKSRTVGRFTAAGYRRLAASSTGVLMGKTYYLSGEVFLAMQARGFRGEVYLLDDFQMRRLDWAALTVFAALAAASIWAGR
jgi:cobalt/nickel transport system permease protein